MAITIDQGFALFLGGVACIFDLRTRRIPNALTFGGFALALAYALVAHGFGGLLTGVEGWVVGLALFLPMFLLGGMGAGDVKLLACLGAWVGPQHAFWLAVYSMIAGGVLALCLAVGTGYLRQSISNVWMLLNHWRVNGIRPLPGLTLGTSRSPRLPYALPIALGTVISIWMR